jgi:M6 family metalloprotease-like protein
MCFKIPFYVCFLPVFTFFSYSSLFAKPASSSFQTEILSDGSSLTIQQRGDENFHYTLSEDGYLLLKNDKGTYFFADGNGTLSTHQATDPQYRDTTVTRFLNSLDKQSVQAKYQSFTTRKIARKSGATTDISRLPAVPTFAKGTIKGLVILVQFKDSQFQLSDPNTEYTKYMNQEGYSNYGMSGSARDFYVQNSNGVFSPTFDVYGPVTLTENVAYYGANDSYTGYDKRADIMVLQAVKALDASIDYDDYDNDGDGYVDFIYVFYAGLGEADGGSANTIWPHASYVEYQSDGYKTEDGVFAYSYATSNEVSGSANTKGIYALDGIGTFAHEFGHVLGLDDLYATDSDVSNETPANWDLMDAGVYNCNTNTYFNSSCTPPNLSAFERISLGWLTPKTLTSSDSIKTLRNITRNEAYVIYNDSNEFFLIENRAKTGWDEPLPGHGILIWHIDYVKSAWENNTINNTPGHPYVDIEEADGVASYGDGGDTFPGDANVTSFTGFTTWAGTTLSPSIYNITETDSLICFTTDASILITSCALPPAHLIYQGPGDTVQSLEQGEKFDSLSLAWENASGATVDGLPSGLSASVNTEAQTIIISGTVDSSATPGTYHYTISTLGGNPDTAVTGTITVTERSIFISNVRVRTPKPDLVQNGNILAIKTIGESQLSLYTLSGKKIFVKTFYSASAISLAPFAGQGIIVAQLVSRGKFTDQEILLLP